MFKSRGDRIFYKYLALSLLFIFLFNIELIDSNDLGNVVSENMENSVESVEDMGLSQGSPEDLTDEGLIKNIGDNTFLEEGGGSKDTFNSELTPSDSLDTNKDNQGMLLDIDNVVSDEDNVFGYDIDDVVLEEEIQDYINNERDNIVDNNIDEKESLDNSGIVDNSENGDISDTLKDSINIEPINEQINYNIEVEKNEEEIVNEYLVENESVLNETSNKIIQEDLDYSLINNFVGNQTIELIDIETKVNPEINKIVKWEHNIEFSDAVNKLAIDVPKEAFNIEVEVINKGDSNKIDLDNKVEKDISSKILGMFSNKDSRDLEINKGGNKYKINYETPAPVENEKVIENELEWKKRLSISSKLHYENVLSYTNIVESKEEQISLFWLIDNKWVDVTKEFDIKYYDTNNNGLIDKIEWITPHLSEQWFQIVINLTGMPDNETEGISIELISPINGVTVNNNPTFNFNVVYNESFNPLCNLSIDNIVKMENIVVVNGSNISEAIVNLDNGFHSWDVLCFYENISSSNESNFNVNIVFDVTIDKSVYNIGDIVYINILAPSQATVNVLIIDPYGWSNLNLNLSGSASLPFIVNILGNYTLNVTMYYLYQPITISKIFEVIQPGQPQLGVSFSANDTNIYEGEYVKFTVSVSNSQGNIDYTMRFGNNSYTNYIGTQTTKIFEHKYDGPGEYITNVTVSNNNQIVDSQNIEIDVNDIDTVDPIIQLISPADGAIINKSYVTFKYKAYDDSLVECGLYLYKEENENPGFYNVTLQSTKTGITNATEESFFMNNMQGGKYIWSIGCEDPFNNSAFSEYRDFTIDMNAVVTLGLEEEDFSDIDSLIQQISDILSKFSEYDIEEREVIDDLELEKFLEDKKSRLEKIKVDIFNIKYRVDLNDEEKEDLKAQYYQEVEDIKKIIPVDVYVLEREEYVNYNQPKYILDVISKYMEYKKLDLSKSEKDKLVDINKDKQSELVVSTDSKRVRITYYLGDEEEITLLTKDIMVNNYSDKVLLELIPKEIAETTEDLYIKNEHTIIEDDPLIEFDIKNSSEKFVYYIKNNVNLNELKNIESVLVEDPSNFEDGNGGLITGFAIFNLKGIGENKWIMLIIVIALLLVFYLLYILDLLHIFVKKQKLPLMELKEINKSKEDLKSHLKDGNLKNAVNEYNKLAKVYNEADDKKKHLIHPHMSSVIHDINMAYLKDLLDRGNGYLSNNDKDNAKKIYGKVVKVYKILTDEHKGKMFNDCNEFFNKFKS